MPMLFDYMTLKLLIWGFVGLFLIVFAITDGFDFGIGAILPWLARNDEERRVVLNVMGPIWEGQQVWLISAGTTLFAAWPLAYATSFSVLYTVLLLLLWTLFLRPVCFDYRSKLPSVRWRSSWDWALWLACLVPAIVFGAAFGNLFLGVKFYFNDMLQSFYTGGFFNLLHPFAVLCGLVSLCMLIMHGGYYLLLRTQGEIATRARIAAQIAGIAYVALFILAGYCLWKYIPGYQVIDLGGAMGSVLTPIKKTVRMDVGLWLLNYELYPWTKVLPITGILGALVALVCSAVRFYIPAFIASCCAVVATIMTAGFSLFPFIFPSSAQPGHSLTLWDSAASAMSLNTIVAVNLFVLPIVTVYVTWVYRKLWGRVSVEMIRSEDKTLY